MILTGEKQQQQLYLQRQSEKKKKKKKRVKKDNFLPSYNLWKHLCYPRCLKDFKELHSFSL